MSPSDPRSATHVAFDEPGADRLLEFGATNVVRAISSLGVGPSRRDVTEHRRGREAWFDCPDTWDQLYAAEIRWEAPVVVWATRVLHDRLNVWRTCSWLQGRGIPVRDVLIINLPPRGVGTPRAPARVEPFECGDSVCYQSDAALRAHLAAARPWPGERYDEALRLWEQYTSADPRRFARSCLRGAGGFPDLGPTWAFLSRFFPRLGAGRSLRVSRYDEILLSVLSREWVTPVKAYVSDDSDGRWEFFGCTWGFVHRESGSPLGLPTAQARRSSTPPGPGSSDSPMRSRVYRLTEQGVRLRARLPQLADAPRACL